MPGRELREFHVFLSSPGDVGREREAVRSYFDAVNRTTGPALGVRFQVIDWSAFASAGVGRPQQLITDQTLNRYRDSLVLVIVLMAQRFGTPSGEARSGTEEEARWALAAHAEHGLPEVKFFFREKIDFGAPSDPDELIAAAEQWKQVMAFRQEIEEKRTALVRTYPGADEFAAVLRNDLDNWLHGDDRPWAGRAPVAPAGGPPNDYPQRLIGAYQWLDISGIDSDRAFKLPLDRVYVRLRVIAGDDAAFPIQTALERYRHLVIVGDPGSGKSTFLRFIALTLAQCHLTEDPLLAADRLALTTPLPVPILISCWDLSEDLQRRQSRATVDAVLDFVVERLTEAAWPVTRAELAGRLRDGEAIVLIDGLDEVPTEPGRHLVARLIDELVERYPANRFVVTSRIRAYTGETILGSEFARCDIQPFAAEERTAFLENWVGQLFSMRGGEDGAAAAAEIAALTEAIETSSIRSLAVNPLLLTVIAIVHWNRKRLPEQRVDLYDECVDVLLGQRKQAEKQRTARDTRVLDEGYDDALLDQRSWVRKRFAEIAFAILERSDEEIDHAAVVRLLQPHFDTAAKAELFLDRQELRSGLFVRRRASSYRFVHLTFQEYLAAWFLAHQDLDGTLETVAPHLRDPKWFETLQLLGGMLANSSDEYLNRYVDWLLSHVGETIREQAPVIALCANVVRDTASAAKLNPGAEWRYTTLLKQTLDAFRPDSKVPKQVQLDLLEAMRGLGASVKNHLITATGSRLLEVRRRALDMLVPHLSDDELFAMSHLLHDKSWQPIRTYVNAIAGRDRARAGRLILDAVGPSEKLPFALSDAAFPALPGDHIGAWPALLDRIVGGVVVRKGVAVDVLQGWSDVRPATARLLQSLETAATHEDHQDEVAALWQVVEGLNSDGLKRLVSKHPHAAAFVVPAGLQSLVDERGGDVATWQFISDLDETTLESLHTGRSSPDVYHLELVRSLLRRRDRPEAGPFMVRLAAAGSRPAMETVIESADGYEQVRRMAANGSPLALRRLLERWPEDPRTAATISGLCAEVLRRVASRQFAGGTLFADSRWCHNGPAAEKLVHDLLTIGCGGALLVHVRFGTRTRGARRVWDEVDELSDDAIDRLVAEDRPNEQGDNMVHRALVTSRRAVLIRLAARGSTSAMHTLLKGRPDSGGAWPEIDNLEDFAIEAMVRNENMDFWSPTGVARLIDALPDRPDVRRLTRRLAAAGSGSALRLLADRRDNSPEASETFRRRASEGSAVALRALVSIQENAEDMRKVLNETVPGEPSATFLRTAAWLEWAIETGGAEAAAELNLGLT